MKRYKFIVSFCLLLVFFTACNTGPQWEHVSDVSIGDLTESIWTLRREPSGTYNVMGVRILVDPNRTSVGQAVLFLPSSFVSGNFYTNNAGVYDERYDLRIYLANRGFTVFTMDYRTSFVPDGQSSISFMANWDETAFLNDIDQAVGFSKDNGSMSKIFLVGHGVGAKYTYLYAAQHSGNLLGMIILDGSPWESDGSPAAMNTMNVQDLYLALQSGDSAENRALFEQFGLTPDPLYYGYQLPAFGAGFNEGIRLYQTEGPDYGPYEGFPTISDYLADQYQFWWGDGQFSNPLGGFSSVEMLVNFSTQASVPYWPIIEFAEDAYTGNWDGNLFPPEPASSLRSKLFMVETPIIVFASSGWTTALGMQFEWKALGPTLTRSTDQTYTLLEGFGHIDVLIGEQAQAQVFEPMYDWIVAHTP